MARDIPGLVASLTLEEKALLTAGADLWTTVPLPAAGIPTFRLSDGPNGARGPSIPGQGSSSACVPCGSALGATWDPALVEEIGNVLGEEARSKACRVLLAPTVNIHRSPLAGRNFECYSEDPLLSGRVAAGFVRGVQSQGVATTVKHFVGNDAEFERNFISSEIDDRTLREIYLVPFELAVREGGTLGVMTGYNRLNGVWCAEHEWLLASVLREEWGFEGFVVSDWWAVGSSEGSMRAGLDLEMPGPGRTYGPALLAAGVEEKLIDAAVSRWLGVMDRVGAFEDPPDAVPQSIDRPEHRAVARRAAAAATVLLQNDGVLPLADLSTLAVVGPNAERPTIMGGGSANFTPHYRLSLLDSLASALGEGVEIRHERGCDIDRSAPLLSIPFTATLSSGSSTAVVDLPDTRMLFFGDPAPGIDGGSFTAVVTAAFTPTESGAHTFTLSQAGRARVLIDGEVVLDGVVDPPPPGSDLLGLGSRAISAAVDLTEGVECHLEVEYSSAGSHPAHGVTIGCRRPAPSIEAAVTAAAAADAVLVVVGTTAAWETEGRDRRDMRLPGNQDELVSAVAAANPNTIVVVNAASPIAMPWADDVAAIVWGWFGGQEMANGLADVLTGKADPGGRLPTTLPMRIEHNPSYGNFPGENGVVRYGEGVLVGYRWYETRHLPVRFPFGHGLSYTTFSIGPPSLSSSSFAAGGLLTVDVPVQNTGDRPGSEVVQCYVAPVQPRLTRPVQELKAFAKVHLGPGESTTVRLTLDDRSFAYWDPGDPTYTERRERLRTTVPTPLPPADRGEDAGWRVDHGEYHVRIGRSSADVGHILAVTVPG